MHGSNMKAETQSRWKEKEKKTFMQTSVDGSIVLALRDSHLSKKKEGRKTR